MFVKAKEVLDSFIPNAEFIYSIEGADFIKNKEELERLYDAGLDSLILCWNNESKYGSGNRSDKGLTPDGVKLINKAIDLGMGIDLSHANKNTFYDLIDVISKRKKDGSAVCCYASHSNSRKLCDVKRNLDDDQLRALKSVDGLLGLVAYGGFTRADGDSTDLKELYLEHVSHAVSIMGIDSVGISTDDMTFSKELFLEDFGEMVFDYSNVKSDLEKLLSKKFSSEDIKKIMYFNSYNKLFKE